jgi:EAL domain-containing protein (putative c-di-GMP-specific phosphodiesterase class I)
VNLKSYETHHFEALIRFDSKKSPYELITFGEDVGLAPEIDMMVTTKTINYILSELKDRPDISIAVNLSGVSVQSTPFIKALQDKLIPYIEKEKIHKRLMFEITESSQINDLEKVNDYVRGLRELGFKIWLDDFGAGAASFQYLHQLHVDGVKIDGQYIDNILASDRGGKLVKSLVRMCLDLDMQTIAERVETVQQAKFLQEIGVDFGQGFLFARPSQKPNFGTLK